MTRRRKRRRNLRRPTADILAALRTADAGSGELLTAIEDAFDRGMEAEVAEILDQREAVLRERKEPRTYRTGTIRVFVPVCVEKEMGFCGGPSGYCEVSPEDAPDGPIIVKHDSRTSGGR